MFLQAIYNLYKTENLIFGYNLNLELYRMNFNYSVKQIGMTIHLTQNTDMAQNTK